MKPTRLILILFTSLLLGGCSFFGGKKAGIQVTANPQANIFLDNKSLGQTPVYQEGLKPGTYTLKVAASDQTLSAWEGKITLNAGALTVIDRQLAADPAKSFGYTLTFEALANKTATEVNLVSFPDTVSVMVDGAPVGFTPFKSDSIAAGGHTFTLTSPGYQDQVIKASLCTYSRSIDDFSVETLRHLRPWPKHGDHIHVRLLCPASSTNCAQQEPVAAGSGCDELGIE